MILGINCAFAMARLITTIRNSKESVCVSPCNVPFLVGGGGEIWLLAWRSLNSRFLPCAGFLKAEACREILSGIVSHINSARKQSIVGGIAGKFMPSKEDYALDSQWKKLFCLYLLK